jgi:hypothetical protein
VRPRPAAPLLGVVVATLLLAAQPAVAQPAVAQSAPPDLQPRLSDRPVAGNPNDQKEQPRLREPPRGPVTQNAPTPTATPAAPAR